MKSSVPKVKVRDGSLPNGRQTFPEFDSRGARRGNKHRQHRLHMMTPRIDCILSASTVDTKRISTTDLGISAPTEWGIERKEAVFNQQLLTLASMKLPF